MIGTLILNVIIKTQIKRLWQSLELKPRSRQSVNYKTGTIAPPSHCASWHENGLKSEQCLVFRASSTWKDIWVSFMTHKDWILMGVYGFYLTSLCVYVLSWGAGQIVPRRNSTPSFLHMRTNSTPSICTCGQIVPDGFSHADKQYLVFLHRRTNSTPSVNFPISLDRRSLHRRYNNLSYCT